MNNDKDTQGGVAPNYSFDLTGVKVTLTISETQLVTIRDALDCLRATDSDSFGLAEAQLRRGVDRVICALIKATGGDA